MKRIVIVIALLLLTGAEVSACNRCGLFGNRCRYYKAPVYYAPAAVVKQADVFVVQNNYPQAIAAQGNTVYGYQAAAAAYSVNPADVLRQSAELSKAASVTASLGISGYNQIAGTQLALQAAISEPLVRGVAASQVLTAAGFTAPAAQSQTLALRITKDVSGAWQVQSAEPAQIQAQVQAAIRPQPEQLPASTSILGGKCARCHGLSMSEPKGSVFIDAGHKLNCDVAFKALKLVKDGKMPKDGPALTPAEKAAFLEELLQLTVTPTEDSQ